MSDSDAQTERGHIADFEICNMTQKLTDRVVKALPLPETGNKISYDLDVRGFGVRVTAAGAKAFVVNYRINGRERRYTIGAYPDWSVAAAREEAKRLKRQVSLGFDPMGDRHVERATPTVTDIAARYMAEHAVRKVPRAQMDDRSMIDKLILPAIGRLKVHEVCQADIDDLHREVGKTRPIRANRMAQLLSKIFGLAIRWGYRPDNPVKGLRRNPEHKRTRYLSGGELLRLTEILATHPNQQSANVIRLLLLTGARRGEVLSATWDQFDLAAGVWVKPSAHTKQRKEHRVPLSAPARQLLSEIQAQGSPPPYVFPGKRPDAPQQDLKSFWTRVCKEAQLEDCRIHDLRHTYASILASAGLSLPVIGALLGHTQPNTTARYSHLYDDPLREATERLGVLCKIEISRSLPLRRLVRPWRSKYVGQSQPPSWDVWQPIRSVGRSRSRAGRHGFRYFRQGDGRQTKTATTTGQAPKTRLSRAPCAAAPHWPQQFLEGPATYSRMTPTADAGS